MTLIMKDIQKCDIFIDTQTPRQFQDLSSKWRHCLQKLDKFWEKWGDGSDL